MTAEPKRRRRARPATSESAKRPTGAALRRPVALDVRKADGGVVRHQRGVVADQHAETRVGERDAVVRHREQRHAQHGVVAQRHGALDAVRVAIERRKRRVGNATAACARWQTVKRARRPVQAGQAIGMRARVAHARSLAHQSVGKFWKNCPLTLTTPPRSSARGEISRSAGMPASAARAHTQYTDATPLSAGLRARPVASNERTERDESEQHHSLVCWRAVVVGAVVAFNYCCQTTSVLGDRRFRWRGSRPSATARQSRES